MTVRELKESLDNFDEDAPVMIGQIQKYGSNWAYEIDDIEIDVSVSAVSWLASDKENVVLLIMGMQGGVPEFENIDNYY